MRIDILIFVISLLLITYFSFQIFNDITNQVGIMSLLGSSFMILLSFVAAALIISHWKESKEVTE